MSQALPKGPHKTGPVGDSTDPIESPLGHLATEATAAGLGAGGCGEGAGRLWHKAPSQPKPQHSARKVPQGLCLLPTTTPTDKATSFPSPHPQSARGSSPGFGALTHPLERACQEAMESGVLQASCPPGRAACSLPRFCLKLGLGHPHIVGGSGGDSPGRRGSGQHGEPGCPASLPQPGKVPHW